MCTTVGAGQAFAGAGRQDNADADAGFLAALDRAGVPYKSGIVGIQVGKKACELMDQGHSKAAVIRSVSSENAGFTQAQATSFTTSAVNAYCPQHSGEPDTVAPPPTNTGMFPWIPFPPPGAG